MQAYLGKFVISCAAAATVALGCSESALAARFQNLWYFDGGSDGSSPNGILIRDSAGNIYGTTYYGGNTSGVCSPNGCGVVFKVDPNVGETPVHIFAGSDGSQPHASVLMDKAGDLYGATSSGGSTDGGVVYKIDNRGNYSILYTFCQRSGCADGAFPDGTLVEDAAGDLIGTAYEGGNTACGGTGCGVVFRLDSSGHEKVLHVFKGPPSDGAYPGELLIYRDEVYGATVGGGNNSGAQGCSSFLFGCGIVYEIGLKGGEKILHKFTGGKTDGGAPFGRVVFDSSGNLYGTAQTGGVENSACGICGVIYKIDSAGVESLLYRFNGPPGDGLSPSGSLVLNNGNLYGTTVEGGANGYGTIFVVSASGKEQVLHSFTGQSAGEGAEPLGLIPGPGKLLYGATASGVDDGTLFSFVR